MLAVQYSNGVEDAWSNVATFVPRFIGLLSHSTSVRDIDISERQRRILALSLAGQRGSSARAPRLDLWVQHLRLALRLQGLPLMDDGTTPPTSPPTRPVPGCWARSPTES